MVKLFDSLSSPTRFAQYLTFCSQPEAAGDVISGTFLGPIVLKDDKYVNFRGPILNPSREMPTEAVRGSISNSFFAITSDGSR